MPRFAPGQRKVKKVLPVQAAQQRVALVPGVCAQAIEETSSFATIQAGQVSCWREAPPP
jgi:hypothetical protein